MSLKEAVQGVHNRVATLQSELRKAHRRIETLERASIPKQEVGSLRRQIAFYCHPDKGGDDLLMRRINAFFDQLEKST